MNLTPDQVAQGRRNFLKILAGTPALAALGVSAALKGPVRGGPVRVGFIGVVELKRRPATMSFWVPVPLTVSRSAVAVVVD